MVSTEDSKLCSIPWLVLQNITGFVYEFCRDQHGSRFIQQKLADAPPQELMAVYQEVEPHVIALMQDVFGNYVIQKCFEHGTKVRRHSYTLRHRQLQLECRGFSAWIFDSCWEGVHHCAML